MLATILRSFALLFSCVALVQSLLLFLSSTLWKNNGEHNAKPSQAIITKVYILHQRAMPGLTVFATCCACGLKQCQRWSSCQY